MDTKLEKSKDVPLRWILTITAVAAIIVKLFYPPIGDRIDFVTAGLVIVAFIPWASSYISKIAIPGVLEAELRHIKRDVEITKQEAQTASQIARRSQDIVLLHGDGVAADSTIGQTTEDQLSQLGMEYVKCRGEMPGGAIRAAAMDRLFGRMLNVAKIVGPGWEALNAWLQSGDPSKQLPGIAYAYAFSERTDISVMLDVVELSKQPFIQYWGLRAIQRAVDLDVPVNLKDIERLQKIETSLRSGTDRFSLASSINRTIESKLQH